MQVQWETQSVSIDDLKPYEKNPRKISSEQLEKLKTSIAEDGYHQRIIANKDLTVIGGHQRIKAMKELGIEQVEVLVPAEQLPHEDFRRILVRDNIQAGEWDMDILLEDFNISELEDWGFPDDLLPDIEIDVVEPEGDEDEAPEPPKEPRTVEGDIYEIGQHRLMCGDSCSIDAVDTLMDGASADMLYTDPPYGMNYSGRGENTSSKILNDNIDPTEMYNLLPEITERYIWGRAENYKHLLVEPRDTIIWVKNNFGMGRGYRGQYECCFYYGDFSGSDSDVWMQAKDSKYDHPTQKPVELCERAIDNSKPKAVVDLFGGSGATMVACHKKSVKCYMMELDPKYCDVIVSRMHKLFPDLPIKLNGEEVEWDE